MQCLKEFLDMSNSLLTLILSIAGIVALIIVLINKLFPLKRGSDEFYYRWKCKKPYCPYCYEGSRSRARVKNERCTKCNKNFKIPPVVIEICPRPKPKITID
jgi:hypothetical protein